jgi:hypothetical protein
MNDSRGSGRRLAGWLCVALGFALIGLLGMGVIGPGSGDTPPASLAAALIGLTPAVLMALGTFVIGLVLLRGGRRR